MLEISGPERDPLYPPPPYVYTAYRRLGVLARTSVEALRAVLPAALEPVGELFEVFFMDVQQVSGLRPYQEAGVVVPCSYRGEVGAHVAYEYVTTDDALTVGREIWGYPKKLAEVDLEYADSSQIRATCSRLGTLMSAEFEPDASAQVDFPVLSPRFQVRRSPGPVDANASATAMVRNVLPDAAVTERTAGRASLNLKDGAGDRLGVLEPLRVVGAEFTRGRFVLDYGQVAGPA
ncbi:acetoacetate decarboxylase family protein [Saccharopolyspora sp. NPDC002686]|uniref:acetoacetate decarboxylase family protein n=1 Tax=Saccharopolyspora sp. NPDC002686 TaxID=3154541 RepID=UPI00332AB33C